LSRSPNRLRLRRNPLNNQTHADTNSTARHQAAEAAAAARGEPQETRRTETAASAAAAEARAAKAKGDEVGSRFTCLAAVIAICVARPVSADTAPDLLKRGIELYKEGKYVEAIGVLKKSYELDATPDALFALAQAERQSGDCKRAAVHYHQVLERMSDFKVAKFVQQNLALCEKDEPPKPLPSQPAASEAKPAPAPIVREVRHVDKLGAVLLAGGALGLGAAGGLYVAANANRAGADRARTFDDHETLSDRAAVQEKAMFVAGGVGVALIGVAVVRWMRGGPKSSTDVAVVPTSSGGALWVTSRW